MAVARSSADCGRRTTRGGLARRSMRPQRRRSRPSRKPTIRHVRDNFALRAIRCCCCCSTLIFCRCYCLGGVGGCARQRARRLHQAACRYKRYQPPVACFSSRTKRTNSGQRSMRTSTRWRAARRFARRHSASRTNGRRSNVPPVPRSSTIEKKQLKTLLHTIAKIEPGIRRRCWRHRRRRRSATTSCTPNAYAQQIPPFGVMRMSEIVFFFSIV